MRIVIYKAMLDEDRKTTLVKEKSGNCPTVQRLDGPEKVAELLNAIFNAENLSEEYVWLLATDCKGKVVGIFEIAHGTANTCPSSSREIFIRACLCGAYHIMLAHNHPSGDVYPSEIDNHMTATVAKAGRLMDIPLVDHVIIGKGVWYSYEEYNPDLLSAKP